MSQPAFRASGDVAFSGDALAEATTRFRETTPVVRDPGHGAVGVAFADVGLPVLATLTPLYP